MATDVYISLPLTNPLIAPSSEPPTILGSHQFHFLPSRPSKSLTLTTTRSFPFVLFSFSHRVFTCLPIFQRPC